MKHGYEEVRRTNFGQHVSSYSSMNQTGVSHMQGRPPKVWTMLENGVRIGLWSGCRASLFYS